MQNTGCAEGSVYLVAGYGVFGKDERKRTGKQHFEKPGVCPFTLEPFERCFVSLSMTRHCPFSLESCSRKAAMSN